MIDTVCTWNAPGTDPFRGDVPAAVEHYPDIPPATRAALRKRMELHQYDDVAEITRDSMQGQYAYTGLRSMHFAGGKVCASVDRSGWSAKMRERGLVYCEDGHCLIVPTVCGNVSRVERVRTLQRPPESAGAGGALPAADVALIGLPPVVPVAPTAFTEAGGAAPTVVVPAGAQIAGIGTSAVSSALLPAGNSPAGFAYALAAGQASPVPEPASSALWLVGLGALPFWRRVRRAKNA